MPQNHQYHASITAQSVSITNAINTVILILFQMLVLEYILLCRREGELIAMRRMPGSRPKKVDAHWPNRSVYRMNKRNQIRGPIELG
ncbi:hypothetical protein B9T62_31475 [Paenibacillus donghaensis]|uniref:Uncharacterized protein n=1 Tax=Paenibacillus donghaensis TaxID=414771 RepID=A0A2Z2KUU8_9BACL|nr:hypothetical protein B9T62_31475 [Paenibacillus donghaensis]